MFGLVAEEALVGDEADLAARHKTLDGVFCLYLSECSIICRGCGQSEGGEEESDDDCCCASSGVG